MEKSAPDKRGYNPQCKTRAKDQPANRATSRPLMGFCRLIQGGARCHHIINQQHPVIGDAVMQFCGWQSACQIALSLAAVQSGLCWASFLLRQCFGGKYVGFILLA